MGELEDREWLLARERGEDVSHVPATTRLTYAHVEWLLATLRDPAPTAGWKRRVLDALDGEPEPRSAGLAEPDLRGGWMKCSLPARTPRS